MPRPGPNGEKDHWRFSEGYVQFFDPVTGAVTGDKFQQRDLVLTEQPKDFADLEKKVTEMDVNELYRYTARLERDGYKSTPYRVDLYSRFSLALTPLILVMLGLGLALRHEQIHLTSMVAVGLGLMFVYWLFFGFWRLPSARLGAFPCCWPLSPPIWPSAPWLQGCCAR